MRTQILLDLFLWRTEYPKEIMAEVVWQAYELVDDTMAGIPKVMFMVSQCHGCVSYWSNIYLKLNKPHATEGEIICMENIYTMYLSSCIHAQS